MMQMQALKNLWLKETLQLLRKMMKVKIGFHQVQLLVLLKLTTLYYRPLIKKIQTPDYKILMTLTLKQLLRHPSINVPFGHI